MEKRTRNIIKIGIVGPESTGKSSLAKALADHYNEPWVPEVARNYIANLNRPYELSDIAILAELQLAAEQASILNAKRFLFCDTTLLVNKIWASFVFKEIPIKITQLYIPQSYDLHLLCDIDLPWEFDPLREHPHHRHELLELYKNDLIASQVNYFLIKGQQQNRLQNALQVINKNFGR